MQANHKNYRQRTRAYGADRQQRINAMWRRYCRALLAAGRPRESSPVSAESRRMILRHRAGNLRGFRFRSAIEAADLATDLAGEGAFRPRPAKQPTAALQGSPEKVDVLARRAARGEELWHPQDGAGGE